MLHYVLLTPQTLKETENEMIYKEFVSEETKAQFRFAWAYQKIVHGNIVVCMKPDEFLFFNSIVSEVVEVSEEQFNSMTTLDISGLKNAKWDILDILGEVLKLESGYEIFMFARILVPMVEKIIDEKFDLLKPHEKSILQFVKVG